MYRHGGRPMPSMHRALIVLPVWCFCVVWMWSWWLFSSEVQFPLLFIPITLALLYEFTLLPSIFLYFVLKAKYPTKRIAEKGKKVAVISLCVPSKESLDIVEKQLIAMSAIKYPHDSWILDEGNSAHIKVLARKHGVKYFSRKGIKKFNQLSPPFQKKTKAGNVNAWLEHVNGYKYDFFVQLDIDHIPKPNYLNKTLGYFRDEDVGWVQAPSVYKNLNHWTARGAAEQELVLQGPLQMGFYGHSSVPFIIGSHCTYRMSAVRKIGGFQPTRAEDHLDTVYLAHHRYRGVFLPEIIAEGDGPETLSTYLAQQFAWAYSMFQVLLGHTPKLLKAMPWRVRWQFVFAQTWYPLWSLSYLILFTCPLIALWLNREVVVVEQPDMLVHFMPIFIAGFLVWWAARPLMQPREVRLSWRGLLLHAVRWPVIFWAIASALFKIKKPYMITPKGTFAKNIPTLSTYRPFLLLGFVSAFSVLLTTAFRQGNIPQAQSVFALSNAVFMLTICTVDISLRIKQLRPKWSDINLHWSKPLGATILLFVTIAIAIYSPFYSYYTQPVFAETSISEAYYVRQVDNTMSTKELVWQIRQSPHNTSQPTLGMYNSNLDVPPLAISYIQHTFVDWRNPRYLALALANTLQSENVPLVTIEPRGEIDGAKLLKDITAGIYDERLHRIGNILAASKGTVYVRFAHEMELANLYPWGNQDPQIYRDAYMHASNIFRSKSKNVQLVWSPAGNTGAEAYYPGDHFVDLIGTTVLYDEYWYGQYLPSFEQLSSSRKWLHVFGKPVWVVEFGAGAANVDNQKKLISDAVNSFSGLGYKALIYLNMKDANIIGPDYSLRSINDFNERFKSKIDDVITSKPVDSSLADIESENACSVKSDNINEFEAVKQLLNPKPLVVIEECREASFN